VIRCGQIVFLSHLVEDSIIKCEQYWPDDSATRLYGVVRVTLTRTTSFANFIVRSFRVAHADEDFDHPVTQYHFTAWPEHGVPRHPLALLEFHAKVSAGGPACAINSCYIDSEWSRDPIFEKSYDELTKNL